MTTMDDLYKEMKDVLRYFDLRFSDMDKVSVSVDEDDYSFVFRYGGRECRVGSEFED